MLKKLYPYTKNVRLQVFLTPMLMILEVIGDIVIPMMMVRLVDQGIAQNDSAFITQQALRMIGIAMISMIFGIISSRLGATAGYGIAGNLRKAAYGAIQNFSYHNLDKISVPSLITRLTSDIDTVGMVSMMSLRMAFRFPFLLLFALIFSFRIHAGLALIFLLMLPLSALVIYLVFRKAIPVFLATRKRVDELNAIIQEQLNGIHVIAAFGRQDHATKEFERPNQNSLQTELKAVRIINWMNPLSSILFYFTLLFVLYRGGLLVYHGEMLPGTIIGFTTYVFQVMLAVMMITMFIVNFSFAYTSLKRIFEIIDTTSEIKESPHPIKMLPDASVRFDHVCFRYPDYREDTLHDISFSLGAGQHLGIIGPTGSSKSTLVKLIARLYDVDHGAIYVGGINVKEYTLHALRENIGIVLQKNTLISGTIRSNMQWGKADATDEEIIDALKKAQAWEFVSRYPDTLDHEVEQNGGNFSGGQKQRLTIARALIKKPKILILDDSTSALDMATDAKLRRVLKNELSGITTITIAQRIDSIRDCDQILVLDAGRLDAIGTHETLLTTSTIYKDIAESQEGGLSE